VVLLKQSLFRTLVALAAIACLWAVPASAKTKKHSHHHVTKVSKHSRHKRGQQAIQEDRAREIQTALIREHYLDGEPTGVWDQRTQTAMAKFQADNGWQTKVLPDSRALIKLGLGPRNDGLLNPETAAAPTAISVASPNPTNALPTTNLVERKVSAGAPQK
jgi:putative peptidoglycan binding protein